MALGSGFRVGGSGLKVMGAAAEQEGDRMLAYCFLDGLRFRLGTAPTQ